MKILAYLITSGLSVYMLSAAGGDIGAVFPDIEGLRKSDSIETFNPVNLYDYIDGAADSYLKYDFSELNMMRYEGEEDVTLKIEIYEHSSHKNAFGIYSNEKPLEGNWLDIGAQGYLEEDVLNFYKGKYYVKIMSNDIKDEDVLINAAEYVAGKLPGETAPPAMSLGFPAENKIKNSERYINKNFLGYKSLSEAFTAEYETGENYFKLFIIEKESADDCIKMLSDYTASINQNADVIKEGRVTIQDPYQGKIQLYLEGKMILGILDLDDAVLSEKYMKLLVETIGDK